jgi:hypothetical protein
MNAKTTSETVQYGPSSEVAAAFADLYRTREVLAAATLARDDEIKALRRYAYKQGLNRKAVRLEWRERDRDRYLRLINAELAFDKAQREFRRFAMIAALTKVIETDRHLKAAA